MKILLVGNKPTNISLDINEYDMIVQINRMNNICNIPKVDLWYCDCHHEFFELNNEILDSNVDLNYSFKGSTSLKNLTITKSLNISLEINQVYVIL